MAFCNVHSVSYFSKIFIFIVFCSIVPASHQDSFSEALELELEEELFSASVNRNKRETESVYDASGINQTLICGLNSLSRTNRRKRDAESQGTHDWPWMAVLLKNIGNSPFCGGTLLNRQYVLTAAHCFFEPGNEKDPNHVTVRLGDWDLNEDEETKYQDYGIKTIEKHDLYSPATEYHDILLIKLDRSVDYTQYIRPLCLPSPDIKVDQAVYIAGWGATTYSAEPSYSNILLDVPVPLIDHENCAKLHAANVDKDIHICAGTRGKDSCQGDSGGPLVIQEPDDPKRWMIVGIVSWGRFCGDYTPGVYTNVKNYLDWIGKRILDAQI